MSIHEHIAQQALLYKQAIEAPVHPSKLVEGWTGGAGPGKYVSQAKNKAPINPSSLPGYSKKLTEAAGGSSKLKTGAKVATGLAAASLAAYGAKKGYDKYKSYKAKKSEGMDKKSEQTIHDFIMEQAYLCKMAEEEKKGTGAAKTLAGAGLAGKAGQWAGKNPGKAAGIAAGTIATGLAAGKGLHYLGRKGARAVKAAGDKGFYKGMADSTARKLKALKGH